MLGFLRSFVASMSRLYRSSPALEQRRLRRLQSSVPAAHRMLPLYRQLYGPSTPRIDSLSDLKRLRILDPAFLRSRELSEITPDGADPDLLILHGTSGSSGTPFRFYQSQEDVNAWLAATLRFFLFSGWRPWWRTALLWREDPTGRGSAIQRLMDRRKFTVSIHWPVERQAHSLRSYRPKMIYGISSALDVLATWMIEHGQTLDSARLVVGMGEAISPGMSERFRAAFGHRGFNYYGANECGLLGWECRKCGFFHFDEDGLVVEVVDDREADVGPGEQGRLLVTTLDRHVLPLIRYDIGDLITLVPPSAKTCSVPFKRFQAVNGRVVDRLILRSGSEMSWHSVYTVTTLIESVQRIQFAQRTDGEVIIRYVPRSGYSSGEIERDVLSRLAITADADIVFERCSEIPLEPSGKFKLITREA